MLTTLSILSLDQGKITASQRRRFEKESGADLQRDGAFAPLPARIEQARGVAVLFRLVLEAIARPQPARR